MQYSLGSVYDPTAPRKRLDIWAHVRFDGPSYPYGDKAQKDKICVDRILVVTRLAQ
jgi:hypothetical protein